MNTTDKNAGKFMHNLGSFGADANKRPNQTLAPMSEQIVIQHLKYCRDLTRVFAVRVFPGFWRQWCKQLLENAEQAKSNVDQAKLFEIHSLVTAVQKPAEQDFCQHLANGFVKFKNKTLHTLTGEERFAGDMLSLVEHSDLEETIAVTSITHRAESLYAEQLWAIQQRMSLLNDGDKIDERSNPTSPVQFCEALRKVLASLEMDAKTKIIGYKIFDQKIISQLDGLYDDVNQYLVEQNLLPNLRFVPGSDGKPEKDRRKSADAKKDKKRNDNEIQNAFDKTAELFDPAEAESSIPVDHALVAVNSGDVQHQNTLLNAIKLLQTHITQQASLAVAANIPAPPPASAAGYVAAHNGTQPVNSSVNAANSNLGSTNTAPVHELHVYNSQQLVNVLNNLQSTSFEVTKRALENSSGGTKLVPQQVHEVSQQMMQQIASQNAGGAVEADDMQTIDLVGMLFEYMLSDEHLPNSVKALLSYLHTPFLKIAFIDKNFFEQPEHPARVLLNSLAEAGVRWVGNDGSDQFDMFTKIKVTVFRLLEHFKNDVRIFAELLIEFNAYANNVSRRQELMERRALEKAQGEEKLREAKLQVNKAVRSRTDGREMPSAILLLLLQPWSDYLSFVLLRYGENSESWAHAVNFIDDLLWTLEPKTLQIDKEEHLKKQPAVIRALEHGFETVGYEQTKGRKLIEAVVAMQKMALQARAAEPAPAPMRSKLENIAAEKAGDLIALSKPQTPDEIKFLESLKMIEFGTWFEFTGGKRLKVAWFNQKTNHYMMVDQQGKKVSLIAGLQLVRQMIAGEARIIVGSTKPFFERALENIYQTLNDRAGNITGNLSQ